MGKGEQTRAAVLDRAVELASAVGLEGLTIGRLAGEAHLSKSGLFAHFASKEDLQVKTLERAAERFVEVVVKAGLARGGSTAGWLHLRGRQRRAGRPARSGARPAGAAAAGLARRLGRGGA